MKAYLLLLSIVVSAELQAQSPITWIYAHPINAGTATNYKGSAATGQAGAGVTNATYTYHFGTNVATTNNNHVVDSFIVNNVTTFKYVSAPLSVIFNRVDNATVTGIRKSMWYLKSGTGNVTTGGLAALLPDYDDSVERVFTKRYLDVGIDNVFQNDPATNNNNIERMDVIFPGGVASTDNTLAGFSVWDRGPGTGHDPFYIAAIMSLDATGIPSAYYDAVYAQSTNYGNAIGVSVPYLIMRENAPADGHLLIMNNTANQNRDGVFFTFSDLNVPANTTIYGYSLFSPNVTVSPASNLVDYTNSTNFPTTNNLNAGGLDPVAITGLWVTNPTVITLAERFSTFQATLTGNVVALHWQLGLSNDVRQLVIERSADGKDYFPQGYLSPQELNIQNWVDEHPQTGMNYYRLKLTNNNNEMLSFSTISTVDVPAANAIRIYPNPAVNKQFVVASTGLADETYVLRLFDGNGRVVFTQTLNGAPGMGKTIKLPKIIPSGLYYLQIVDNKNNKILVRSIMVN